MTARVLVLGLDSCDSVLVKRFVAEGELPHLAAVLDRGTTAELCIPFGVFVGSVWRSFNTARLGHRVGRHCWDEIDSTTYEHRLVPVSRERGRPFWLDLSESGKRVAILDVPHARPEPVNGIIVAEWGCHDHHVGLTSWPPEEAGVILDAHGLHPVLGFDAHAIREFSPDDYALRAGPLRTADEERALASGLVDGVAKKTAWVTDRLRSDDWDLFVTVFGEGHAVGHQQWHLHDETHPRYDAAVVRAIGGDPLRRVYRALDEAVGAILAETDEDTTVLVLLSHGMGAHHDGSHLLEEVLRRIDITDSGGPLGGPGARLIKRAVLGMSVARRRRLFPALAALSRRAASRRCHEPVAAMMDAGERAGHRFYLQPNNTVFGGVRLNVVGRERSGLVQADAFDLVCERLADDLLSLVNVATGQPVINAVHRADDHYEREVPDTLPDLFIDWNHAAAVETVWSPKTGVVHAPYRHWRTGDHRPEGLLAVIDPTIAPGPGPTSVRMEELGPTLAARFGVTLSDADCQPVDWMVPRVSVE